MKDVGSGMGVKNMSNLVFKEIYGICETKKPYKRANERILNNRKRTL